MQQSATALTAIQILHLILIIEAIRDIARTGSWGGGLQFCRLVPLTDEKEAAQQLMCAAVPVSQSKS